jgi:xanthine dehydrogenase accessory factor
MLVWGDETESIGTVGGGRIEADVVSMARDILPRTESQVVSFHLAGTEDNERGICGGRIELLIETFDKKGLPLFDDLATFMEKGGKGALVSIIRPKKSPEKILLQDLDQADKAIPVSFSPEIVESIRKVVDTEQAEKRTLENGIQIFIEAISKQPMVFIFGAGHLSYHISRYAKSLGFRVTVCDDRAEFANTERFPDVDGIVVENFDRVFGKIDIDNDSYIVIVTKGHKYDEIVLEMAVKTDAKYVGMIGSKRKTSTILRRLREKGIPEKTLERVYSPIGISIGAVTPEEIALSIVCELVKIRRLGDGSKTSHMTIASCKDLQEEQP